MQEKKAEFIVSNEQANIRLDKAVTLLDKEISRMEAQRLIEEGNILVDDKKQKPSYKVFKNERITIKKFIVSDKNKYRALFAAIVLLINLIIDIL